MPFDKEAAENQLGRRRAEAHMERLKQERLARNRELAARPPMEPSIQAREPSTWESIKDFFGVEGRPAIQPKFYGEIEPGLAGARRRKGAYIYEPFRRGEDPAVQAMGSGAYLTAKTINGLLLHSPELLLGADAPEKLYSAITQTDLDYTRRGITGTVKRGPSLKAVGDLVEFVGGIRTAGVLAHRLIGYIPIGVTPRILGETTLTFVTRNLSEQAVDRIKKGEKISLFELGVESALGLLYGAGRVGGAKLRYYKLWKRRVASHPIYGDIPKRLQMRADEAVEAAAGGMKRRAWEKVYKKDITELQGLLWEKAQAAIHVEGITPAAPDAAPTRPMLPGAAEPRALGPVTRPRGLPGLVGRDPLAPVRVTGIKYRPKPAVPTPPVGPITPQPTAIQKSNFSEWATDYSAQRARDLGVKLIPDDTNIREWRLKTLQSMAKTQGRFGRRLARKMRRTEEPNIFNPWISARHAFLTLEERTGVPLYGLYDKIHRTAGARSIWAYDEFTKDIKISDLAGLTSKDNEHIIKYLFSAETRADIEDAISPNTLMLAMKLEDILQGPAAREVQLMVARRWIKSGKAPPDAKKYGKPEALLDRIRTAKAEGRLREYVESAPEWRAGMGVRRFYYMSNPAKQDIIDDYIDQLSLRALHKPQVSAEKMPGTISYEAYARKGKPPFKEGSVITNTETHFRRIAIANAVADDLEAMYSRLNTIDLSNTDMKTIKEMFSNLLMKRQVTGEPWKAAITVKRWFWRTRLSLITRPDALLWMSFRNALQNYGMGPTAVNLKESARALASIGNQLRQGKSLAEIDPEMWSRLERDFPGYVSQRRAYYHEFLLQDTGNISREFGSRAAAQKAASLLERTGGLYGWVDEFVNRMPIWVTQYQVTKNAAIAYRNGQIDLSRFLSRTRLDTVRTGQQMLAQDLLDAGRIDDLAAESANWLTEDVNLKYKTPERAGVEQTMEKRTFMGIYTFPRGAAELWAYRGIIPMLKGVETGNWGQARRGAENTVKGLAAGTLVSALMGAVVGKKAYDVWSKGMYELLGPGAGTVAELLSILSINLYKHRNGDQTLLTTVDRIADGFAGNAEEFLPLANTLENVIETIYDTKGLSTYKIVKDGVAVKMLGKDLDWKKVERTGWQKVIHLLVGGFERPAGEAKELSRPRKPAKPKH